MNAVLAHYEIFPGCEEEAQHRIGAMAQWARIVLVTATLAGMFLSVQVVTRGFPMLGGALLGLTGWYGLQSLRTFTSRIPLMPNEFRRADGTVIATRIPKEGR